MPSTPRPRSCCEGCPTGSGWPPRSKGLWPQLLEVRTGSGLAPSTRAGSSCARAVSTMPSTLRWLSFKPSVP
ncbi:hypothetical protein MRX96_024814 [Rhipicephalus microplus]